MYEARHDAVLPRQQFFRRVGKHVSFAFLALAWSLAIGMAGFHWLAGEQWIDAFLNSTMLLGGMGPVGPIDAAPDPGKIFAGFYALYAGVIFLGASALIAAPFLHRVLHKMHAQEEQPKRG